jgi:hypothetical protein
MFTPPSRLHPHLLSLQYFDQAHCLCEPLIPPCRLRENKSQL